MTEDNRIIVIAIPLLLLLLVLLLLLIMMIASVISITVVVYCYKVLYMFLPSLLHPLTCPGLIPTSPISRLAFPGYLETRGGLEAFLSGFR